MGVKIKELLSTHPISINELKGKKIAIDAYNTLYQFLSSIRGWGGYYLTDESNNVTSHLAGIFYRNMKLLSYSIWPLYVFDGTPHNLKGATLKSRFKKREEAMEEWKSALESGDEVTAMKKAKASTTITEQIVESSKKLLSLMGIPCITAPSDGEAYASFLLTSGVVWAVASQDYDAILFGSSRVIRNLAVSIKRKNAAGITESEPEILYSDESLNNLGIDLRQMIDIAILVGTDFNEGIKGIGPKKAYKLIKKYEKIENIPELGEIENQHVDEVRTIFYNSGTKEVPEIKWGSIDKEGLIKYMCDEHNFSRERITETISRIIPTSQNRLDSFF
ncbi:MAG: flap endonuclease-1 [Candidatus Thermoplasmatota archaeon]|jgi:flap endonuclease-1|nr:flap endonuclease-1 [Candidatus Thermoplasmatota archaeon]MCL5962979.1 flap endonuclease-1 [Candidatus Thermoplasmatota archaeon]